MKCNNELYEFIKACEGCSLTAYRDSGGTLTIGFGHTSNVKEGDKITESIALKYLISDIEKTEKQLDSLLEELDRTYTDYQYSALVSFTFNLGVRNTRKLLKNRSNVSEIANAMKQYCHDAKGNKLRGLVKRREEESNYFLNYQLKPVSKVLYAIKPNYHIRKAPAMSGDIIITYDFSVFVEVLGLFGDWVSTNRGFIHKDAFYDTFQ